MQGKDKFHDKHIAFIADKDGVHLLYPVLLQMLREDETASGHFSFLYFQEDETCIFQKEIDILSRRFSHQLIAYTSIVFDTALLETILNTNTKREILFHIALHQDWEVKAVQHLRFLDIPEEQIITPTFQTANK